MKATITFDLNDLDDKQKHKLFTHIDSITYVIWKLDEDLRRIVKYDETKSEDYKEACSDARQLIHELLNAQSLSIDELS